MLPKLPFSEEDKKSAEIQGAGAQIGSGLAETAC